MDSKYKVQIEPEARILIVEHPETSTTLDKLYEIKELLEKSTGKEYLYGMVYRKPCYWFSYDLNDRSVIVCGRVNKKECIDETKSFNKN